MNVSTGALREETLGTTVTLLTPFLALISKPLTTTSFGGFSCDGVEGQGSEPWPSSRLALLAVLQAEGMLGTFQIAPFHSDGTLVNAPVVSGRNSCGL